MGETAKVVIDTMADAYPHLAERRAEILGRHRARGAPVQPHARGRHGPARGGADPADLGRARRGPLRPRRSPTTRPSCPAPSRSSSTTRTASRSTSPSSSPPSTACGPTWPGSATRWPSSAIAPAPARRRTSRRPPELASLYNALLAPHRPDRVPGLRHDDRRRARRRDPPRRRRVRDARGGGRGRAPGRGVARGPRSCSTARRSTPRAAARSRTRASCGSADGTVLFEVEDVQRVAGTQTAGLTVHRGVLHGRVAVGRHGRRPRSMPSDVPTPCATTRARTCCIGRSGTSSATRRARRARSSIPTTCASTTRSTAR